MNDHKKSEGSIDQFSTRIRARRTLEEHNEMKTFKKMVLEVWNSKSFRKNRFDYLTFEILQKKTFLRSWPSPMSINKSHWSWWYHFPPLCFFLWIQVGVRFVKNNWQCKEIRIVRQLFKTFRLKNMNGWVDKLLSWINFRWKYDDCAYADWNL